MKAYQLVRFGGADLVDYSGMFDPTKMSANTPRPDDGPERTREYLKTCFGILYRYHVLRRIWFGEKKARTLWMKDLIDVFTKWRADTSEMQVVQHGSED
jgi:hypothetical protein